MLGYKDTLNANLYQIYYQLILQLNYINKINMCRNI